MADEPKTNRREFLTGRALAGAVEQLFDAPADEAARPLLEPPTPLLNVGREAMACLFEVCFSPERHPAGADAALAALDEIDRLEAQLTVYRDSSEVSALNRTAGDGLTPVEPSLFALLAQAQALSRETAGAFDVTTGRLTRIWGFYRRQGRMPTADEIAAALADCGAEQMELDAAAAAVRFLRPGLEINLGAIGKGYALDCGGQRMRELGLGDFLFHGGGSSVLAAGCRPGNQPGAGNQAEEHSALRGWLVGLRHPLRPEERLAEFELCDQALGTSGAGNQFFHHQGKRYGHILDPRSGWPAEQVLSSTVIAPTAALADALSTACYVLGVEGAARLCAARPEISVLLTRAAPGSRELELIALNLPPHRWRRTN